MDTMVSPLSKTNPRVLIQSTKREKVFEIRPDKSFQILDRNQPLVSTSSRQLAHNLPIH